MENYTEEDYYKYKETRNYNLFEEVIDNMILDGISIEGLNDTLREKIRNFPLHSKRLAILSILDHAVNRNDKSKFTTHDFFTLFYENSNLSNIFTKNKVLNVNNEIERESLISYMKCKIARFGLYINKISQDLHISRYLNNIPIPPLDRIYNDEILCELFNISDDEFNIIDQLISDYYK
jgi:hypothetical protein